MKHQNGDTIVYEYHNGILLHRSAIYANQQDRITETRFIQSDNAFSRGLGVEVVENIIMFSDLDIASYTTHTTEFNSADISSLISPASGGGVITFSQQHWWDPAPTFHRIQALAQTSVLGSTTFTITNQINTAASWISIFIWALTIPAWVATATFRSCTKQSECVIII